MKLTQANYYSKRANMTYMSVSQFKAFDRCPHAALAEVKGRYVREKTTPMLVGGYVDAYFEGTLPQFKQQNPDIFKKDGTLKSEFVQAETIIERIKRDRTMMRYLSGLKQVIMTGTIGGVAVKVKIDSLLPDKIVDLKVMRDFDNVRDAESGILPWFEAWGYSLQGAVYQEIVFQNTGKRLPFYLAAATKEKVTDIDIVHIGQDHLDFQRDKFVSKVDLFDAIKNGIVEAERCEKCDYCKQTKTIKEPTEADEFYLF